MADIVKIYHQVYRKADFYNRIQKTLKYVKDREVLVGIPQKTASRETTKDSKGSSVTNAELLYIHTNGSPINNIPPRPVIGPAIKNDAQRLNKMFEKATDYLLQAEYDKADRQLETIGIRAQNICRKWFVNPNNGWAPNSPATIAAKGSDKPLIDTGELRKSITYVVKKGGKVVK